MKMKLFLLSCYSDAMIGGGNKSFIISADTENEAKTTLKKEQGRLENINTYIISNISDYNESKVICEV